MEKEHFNLEKCECEEKCPEIECDLETSEINDECKCVPKCDKISCEGSLNLNTNTCRCECSEPA